MQLGRQGQGLGEVNGRGWQPPVTGQEGGDHGKQLIPFPHRRAVSVGRHNRTAYLRNTPFLLPLSFTTTCCPHAALVGVLCLWGVTTTASTSGAHWASTTALLLPQSLSSRTPSCCAPLLISPKHIVSVGEHDHGIYQWCTLLTPSPSSTHFPRCPRPQSIPDVSAPVGVWCRWEGMTAASTNGAQ